MTLCQQESAFLSKGGDDKSQNQLQKSVFMHFPEEEHVIAGF